MKINLLIIAISISVLTACSASKSEQSTTKMEMTNASEMEKSQTIQLKKGELFVAVVGNQMAGKEDLLKEYFGIVFPPAQKNGFTPLGQLAIDENAAGGFIANEFVGLFKWPGMENVQSFLGEVSAEKLAKLRVDIWTDLKQHMIMVPEDIEMTFKENKTYEVKMIWSDQTLNTDLIVNNGGTIIAKNKVAGYEDLHKNEGPNTLLIIEWKSIKAAESFRKMKLMKLNKEEAFYTHFIFPEVK